MTDRLVHEQQLVRLLGRAAQLQEEAGKRELTGATGEDAQPAGSYRLSDIKAAAAEAGIDERFVALAALELAAAGPQATTALTPLQRRQAARWLGAREPGLAQAQRVQAPFERLMAAIGSTLQMPAYGLRLTDTTPDLTRGGTLLLKLPEEFIAAGAVVKFAYYLRGTLGIDNLRLTIEPRGDHDHELGVAIDLEPSWQSSLAWSRRLAAVFGGIAAWIAWAIASSLAAPLAATVLLVALLGALGAWCGLLIMRWTYASRVAMARQQLRALLGDIDGAVRSLATFGVLPPRPPTPGPGTDDAQVLLSATSLDA
jgi:hypothetical protein